jgi:hypothetical protein
MDKKKHRFDIQLLQHQKNRSEFSEAIERCFQSKRQSGDVEERWNEMKTSVIEAANNQLHKQGKKHSKWMTEETFSIVEAKRGAFIRWQEHRTDATRHKEYRDLCKKVRKAVKEDKEKWLDGVMKGMEDNMKSNCVGDFFKKMKRLNGSNVTTTTAILDENGHPLHKSKERLARWRQHFEKVLNVQGTVEENVIGSLEQPSDKEVPEITREEVEQAMKRLKNGRAAGEDEIVAELLKNGGDAMID